MGNPPVIWANANPDEIDAGIRAYAEQMAWDTLSALSGGYLAINPVTVRPLTKRTSGLGAPVGPFNPHYERGGWRNNSCDTVPELALEAPVGRVVNVLIDGVELTPSAYRLDNGNLLVRQDGGVWPTNQDLSAPLGAPNTFAVTYYQGYPVDDSVRFIAGVLAEEYRKDRMGEHGCRLPEGVASITRQGVSFEVSSGLFENGLTEIREVDALLRVLNPHRQKSPPRIVSPDSLRRLRRTTPHNPTSTPNDGLGDSRLGLSPLGA